ncbi:MAG: hypothetical protein Kow0029_16710 [Candidatus Rifleibacteriota bacterium]
MASCAGFATTIDPLSVLDSLPPPEVRYDKAPSQSYPPKPNEKLILTPITPPSQPLETDKKMVQKKIIESLDSPHINSFKKLINNLSRPPIINASQSEDLNENEDSTSENEKSLSKPRKTRKITKVTKTLQNFYMVKDAIIDSFMKSWRENYEFSLEALDYAQKFQEAEIQKEKEKQANEKAEEKTAEEEEAKSFDGIHAKALALKKKEKWKDIKKLYEENEGASNTTQGMEYLIEAELHESKPNYFGAKRLADQILKKDPKNPLANYALALYYYNHKKPNPAKAAKYLDIALKAKKPPEGASKLYWMMLLKKFYIILLLLLAGIIAGVNQFIKKRKAVANLQIAEGESNIAGDGTSESTPQVPAASPGKLDDIKATIKQKLKPVIDKLEPILNKIRKKKASSHEEANNTVPEKADNEKQPQQANVETEAVSTPAASTAEVAGAPIMPASASDSEDLNPAVPSPGETYQTQTAITATAEDEAQHTEPQNTE